MNFGSLPSTFRGTPQEFADLLAANAKVFTEQQFALFVTGSTAPTSDVGPWLANGNEWRVWDSGLGQYVPITIDQDSLGYFIGSTTPDQNVYQFWIQTDGSGSPLALKTYYSGAWVDVYAATLANYSTTSQMNTAINNAVAGVTFASYPARGTNAAAQSIPVDGTPHKVTVDTAAINPSPAPLNTSTSRYVAPAVGTYCVALTSQFDNDTGTASGMQVCVEIYKNGVNQGLGMCDATPSPNGSRWYVMFTSLVTMSVNDYLEVWVTATDGVNTGAIDLTTFDFNVFRVSANS